MSVKRVMKSSSLHLSTAPANTVNTTTCSHHSVSSTSSSCHTSSAVGNNIRKYNNNNNTSFHTHLDRINSNTIAGTYQATCLMRCRPIFYLIEFGSVPFVPPPVRYAPPQSQSTCHYIVNHYAKIRHVRLGRGGGGMICAH